jgi:hypothetical protein
MAGIIIATATTLFRVCATRLRAACGVRGVRLPQRAAEAYLAERLRADAEGGNVPHRVVLRDYLTDERLDSLVDDLASGSVELHDAVGAASPVLLVVPEAARIVAALGQLACWAAANRARDPWHADILGETAGTAVTLWAFAIENADDCRVTLVSADTAVRTRYALRAFLDRVSDGSWTISSTPAEQHGALRDAIERDLALLS